jgi:hypothetical protein
MTLEEEYVMQREWVADDDSEWLRVWVGGCWRYRG